MLLAPPYPYLAAVAEILEGTRIILAAQDVSPFDSGAYTGQVSTGMLLDLGCTATLVGHSERRAISGDTDEIVHDKVVKALDAGLHTVLCVGEVESERERGEAESVVRRQLSVALDGVRADQASLKLSVAYEPVWAIGTGKTATSADAQEMHHEIREFLESSFGGDVSARVRILYGGSVKPSNAGELLAAEDIDGVLVGGASLDAESFSAIYSA